MKSEAVENMTIDELIEQLNLSASIISNIPGSDETALIVSRASRELKKMKSALKPIMKCTFDKSRYTGAYIMTHGNAVEAVMEAQNIMKGQI